nr:chemotaxis protein CheA [Curvibacter sp. CHRR-16]
MPAFMSEAVEQTDAMESLLLELEDQPDNKNLLDALFRCAHTVKGSAGMFGLSKVVEFTHHVESLLDKMRDGKLQCTADTNTLLLQSNDHIRLLVKAASDDSLDTDDEQTLRALLVQQLNRVVNSAVGIAPAALATSSVSAPPSSTPERSAMPDLGGTVHEPVWRIQAQFGPETFRNGMDPLAVLRYLATLGTVLRVQALCDSIPVLTDLIPEDCHIGFVLELQSTAAEAELREAFSFVEDDCQYSLEMLPPTASQMVQAIENLPDTPRLGDLMVTAGVLAPEKVAQLLHAQSTSEESHKPKLGELLTSQAGIPAPVVTAALGKQQKMREASAAGGDERYIRVQADKLDAVINLLGELVIASAGATLMARTTKQVALLEANLQMGNLIEEIRNGTLALRMVPIGETFSRFKRVVRDTAAQLGKEVVFDIYGGDSELDKSMVEKIADPLMHLVRNALDHGLETPHDRVAAGKSAEGHLVLRARHETGAILIQIQDDGRGINRDKVLQRAWDRGLVEQGVVPPDDDINMLIFEPGFSTAEQVTDLSGRGVGMDVVRRNIEALRGSLKLVNTPGKGLRVDIRLPLTLAIIDGFLVAIGKSKFVLPLESVVEVIEAKSNQVHQDDADRHCVELRGAVLPVVRLRALYSLEASGSTRSSVVVVQSPKGKYGIEVDTLLGQNQIVIKPLGRLFKTLRGISGSSVLGSGEVALIVDVVGLADLAMQPPKQLSPAEHGR